ncbi:MAG TPA: YgeY family selenium metabolism-linked hydrolase [Bacteroidota bacterium]|nr:YgeY family selenium metabolism-linked hydrolase [Bacteroidota bacterium]
MNPYQKIYQKARALQDETLRVAMELIRTPSFSSKEHDAVQVLCREMEKIGLDEIRIDGLGSVIGRIGNGPRSIAFDGHVDTVYAGDRNQWSSDPFVPKIEHGKLWGRGSVDQKGGLAAMLSAARIIKEFDLCQNHTVYFTGTVMEEDCDGLCWQHLIREEHLHPDAVVITEPTNLYLYRGHRGRMEMDIEIRGRSCHSSTPECGDNAVYKLARIALEIEKLDKRLVADAHLGKGSVSVTVADSSSPSACAVPDGGILRLDRRLTRGETKDSAIAEVHDAIRRAGYNDATVSVPIYREAAYTGKVYPTEKYYPMWLLDEDSPFLKSAIDAFESVFGNRPQAGIWGFSSNAVAVAGMHAIPCVVFGPGNELLAHTADEACEIGQLTSAAAFYASLVAHLSGGIEHDVHNSIPGTL